MKGESRHDVASRILREFGGGGDSGQREVRSVDLSRGGGWLHGEHGAVGVCADVHGTGTGAGDRELVGGGSLPERERTAGRVAERHEYLVARSVGLQQRRSGDAGDFWLRGRLQDGRTYGQIDLAQTRGTSALRAFAR